MQEVLYRKYRSKTFDEVVGQDHIVNTLEKSIKDGKLAHAYLFSGGRGLGKTSVARILAEELGTSPNDLFEIDAASNRGIDDIRGLRESVRALPFDSKYKVYIIDEVHMLTKEAWGALLKTLEEPPSYVIFILATTDIDKVPDTIVSRCVTFSFKIPTIEVLKKFVAHVAEKEKVKLEDGSLEIIAIAGDGSFRDTLGILQKVITASSDKKITEEEVADITGAPSSVLVNNFVESIAKEDPSSGLQALSEALSRGSDMMIFARLSISKFRYLLMSRYAKDKKDIFSDSISQKDREYLDSLDISKSKTVTSKTLVSLLDSISRMRGSISKSLPLEIALFDSIEKANEK